MSGPSLTDKKINKMDLSIVAVSNTFDIAKLNNKNISKVYYFISDPNMVINKSKRSIVARNVTNDANVILVIPYRFLKYMYILKLRFLGNTRIRFYHDDLSGYRKNKYSFSARRYPNLQSVVVDVVIPYLLENERKDLCLYGVDLNYGVNLNKAYSPLAVSSYSETVATDQLEWAEFVSASILFYKAIAKRHYDVNISFDQDSGLANVIKSYVDE